MTIQDSGYRNSKVDAAMLTGIRELATKILQSKQLHPILLLLNPVIIGLFRDKQKDTCTEKKTKKLN